MMFLRSWKTGKKVAKNRKPQKPQQLTGKSPAKKSDSSYSCISYGHLTRF